MIAFVEGTVAERLENSLVINNNGIGYRIYVPLRVIESVSTGEEIRLYTHMSVREDGISLFGFLSREDLSVFRLLLGVSGIGPKGALSVLSALSASDLKFAVLSDDVSTISSVPGLGKKTAQKLILELKDKLDLETALQDAFGAAAPEGVTSKAENDDIRSEAVMALTALGYSGTQAMKAVRDVLAAEPELDVGETLKKALKKL